MSRDPTIRFRVDFGPQCSIGIGKIELLEGIASHGSLSRTARQMRMSYRRAWLLLADLNLSFDAPVAVTSTGGRGGGGVVLTRFGEELIAGYRTFESTLRPLAAVHLLEFGKRVSARRRPEATHRPVAKTSIKRKKSAH